MSQWSGRSSTCYYETVVDPRTSVGLVWWPSPDFGFLSVMERERDGRSFLRLIDILEESVVNELVVEGRLSRDRFLTTNGSVGFGMEKEGKRAFVIWTYSQERFGVTYPKEARVIHLMKDKVIFHSKKNEIVTAKDYQNNVVSEVNLRALTDLGVQYLLSFNPRGSLELVTYAQGKLRVHHTDLESLPIDARRWELLGERRRAAQLESAADDVLQRDEEQRAHEQQEARQTELVNEMKEQLSPPPPPEQPTLPFEGRVAPVAQPAADIAPIYFNSKEEADEALERLRMRYIAGELTREDYYNEKTVIERAAAAI